MRILLAHDHYRSSAPSGEDAVFRNEHALLTSKGFDVIPFERYNDHIDASTLKKRIQIGLEGAWSQRTYTDLAAVVRRTRPDVAHFHNTFPLISPSAYAACQDNAVPVVQTLHNYRLICAGALLMREGRPCEDCVGTSLVPAIRHRCYRGSLPATAAVVWMLARNRWRGIYRSSVNRYIALTEFAASRLVAGGLPADRIEVKPNFLPDAPPIGDGSGNYAVYVGRLSREKGVESLLRAWKEVRGLTLKVVGDGPLRGALEQHAARDGLAVEFLGRRPRNDAMEVIRRAQLQVVPSEWYEAFPLVVLEAYACGTPVLASRIGSLDEIVVEGESGLKFAPGDSSELARRVNELVADPQRLGAMRSRARALFESKYGAETNFARLMQIYEKAIHDHED